MIEKKKPCPGCYGNDTSKPKTRVMCKIKNCNIRILRNIKYCFECEQFSVYMRKAVFIAAANGEYVKVRGIEESLGDNI